MEELVSVIIPTYKGENHIYSAIKSVVSQTYNNIEIIVVDDNGIGTESQINTENEVKKFKNKNIIYIKHHENKNGSAARNTAMKVANGSFYCFLDDDDEFLPDKIKLQVELFKKLDSSYGLVFGSVIEKKSDDNELIHYAYQSNDYLFDFLTEKIIVCSSTVMIRSSAVQDVGLWDETFKRHQDWEYFARVIDKYKVGVVTECCVIKNRLDNNLPKDAFLTEKYREHFLSKMQDIINKFPNEKKSKIYNHHYIDVGKMYIKNRDIKNAIRLAKKTSSTIFAIFIYFFAGVKYLLKRR